MHSISSDCLFAEKEEMEGGEGGKTLGILLRQQWHICFYATSISHSINF